MKFDDLPGAWQDQNDQRLSSENRDAMIARVCRRVERLNGMVTRRDVTETLAALVVIVFFGGLVGRSDHIVAKVGAGILVAWGLFIVWKLHRARAGQRRAPIDAPLREFCHIEAERLERQIRLLRTVLWWYIAPCIVGVNLVFVGSGGTTVSSLTYGVSTLLVAWSLYAINMRAVAKELLPARDELALLLSELGDPESQVSSATSHRPDRSPALRAPVIAVVLLSTLAVLGALASAFLEQSREYPKLAPFSGVRWEGSQPVVKIGDEWFTLVSLDGVDAQDIVAYSKRTYLLRWQKRFEEDLVEVLTRMGHEPKETVQLGIRPLGSSSTRTLDNVPMTEANRRIVYEAARRR